MRPIFVFALLVPLVTILSAPRAPAATIHFPLDEPTIQAGIDAARDGDTILVAPGTYGENIDLACKSITVASEAGEAETVIDGNRVGSVVIASCGDTGVATIDGFTIRNG